VNAIPEVKPIATAVVIRPAFDNTQIASFRRWIEDNTLALARYWHAQGNALGLGKDDDADFDFWLRVQYDIERAR